MAVGKRKKTPQGSDGRQLHAELAQLIEAVHVVEEAGGAPPSPSGGVGGAAPTGWAPVGRLARGALHEWYGVEPHDPVGRHTGQDSAPWAPPLGLMVHLARQTLAEEAAASSGAGYVVWIGRRVWPHPRALAQADAMVLERSLFVEPPDDAGRLWAIDLALRCAAFSVVVADASGATMPHTRRLQLAASSGGALGLLARPPNEMRELSAATTRWQVAAAVTGEEASGEVNREGPWWRVTLARCKGRQTQVDTHGGRLPRSWMMEQDRGQGDVRVHAEVVDRPGRAAMAAKRVAM